MDAVADLLSWAATQGVEVGSVRPSDIDGHGRGMVATRNIEQGEVVMTIPIKAIRSLESIPESIRARLSQDASIHGLLAADFTLHPPQAETWAKLVPKLADFKHSIPYFWPHELQELLPREAKNILARQERMITRDLKRFIDGFPSSTAEEYLYSWFLVGTRAFYYETKETLAYPWHDRLAILPVADMFNHAAAGCSVFYSPSECYTIMADRKYLKGDEVYTSYGDHSNDYLLAEYGFVLLGNSSDRVCLDDVLLPKLNTEQKALLEERDMLGDFTLSGQSKPCERTRMALQLLCEAVPQSANHSKSELGSPKSSMMADKLLRSLLIEFQDRILDIKKTILASNVGEASQRAVLLQRWNQIEAVVKAARGGY